MKEQDAAHFGSGVPSTLEFQEQHIEVLKAELTRLRSELQQVTQEKESMHIIHCRMLETREKTISGLTSRLQQEREWISVEDRLPENNDEKVLTYRPDFGGQYRSASWMAYTDQDQEWFKKTFTHWKPLPEPPKKQS